jgi:hypothetical protein
MHTNSSALKMTCIEEGISVGEREVEEVVSLSLSARECLRSSIIGEPLSSKGSRKEQCRTCALYCSS